MPPSSPVTLRFGAYALGLRRHGGKNKMRTKEAIIILYGSYARGSATEDSDIDLLIVLEGKVKPGEEIDRMIE